MRSKREWEHVGYKTRETSAHVEHNPCKARETNKACRTIKAQRMLRYVGTEIAEQVRYKNMYGKKILGHGILLPTEQ